MVKEMGRLGEDGEVGRARQNFPPTSRASAGRGAANERLCGSALCPQIRERSDQCACGSQIAVPGAARRRAAACGLGPAWAWWGADAPEETLDR